MQVGCQNAVQAAAVFITSYELIMFIQNSTCTIKIGLTKPVLAAPQPFSLVLF